MQLDLKNVLKPLIDNYKLSGASVWRPQSGYTVSRIECRIKVPQNSEMSRQNRATTPQNQGVAPFSPLSHFPLIRSRQKAKGGCRGGLVAGIAFGFRKQIALHGGVAATVTPIALLCATKTTKKQQTWPR